MTDFTFGKKAVSRIAKVVRQVENPGYSLVPPRGSLPSYGPAPVFFRNNSGHEVPAYGCMFTTDAEERDGEPVAVIKRPDSNGSGECILFNGPYAVANGDHGLAQHIFGSATHLLASSVSAGDTLTPSSGSFSMATTTGEYYTHKVAGQIKTGEAMALPTPQNTHIARFIRFSITTTALVTTSATATITKDAFYQGYDPGTITTIDNHPASTNYIFEGAIGAKGMAIYTGLTNKYMIIQLECA